MSDLPFWKQKSLADMTSEEWESLCDGCGKCCVLKIEDIDTGEVHYTDVACRLLDCSTASCRDYANRKQQVPDCIMLTPQNLDALPWMPDSCAYRVLHEGGELASWHPLVCGDGDGPARPAYQSQDAYSGRIGRIDGSDRPYHAMVTVRRQAS